MQSPWCELGKEKLYKLRRSVSGRKFEVSILKVALGRHFILSFIDCFSEYV